MTLLQLLLTRENNYKFFRVVLFSTALFYYIGLNMWSFEQKLYFAIRGVFINGVKKDCPYKNWLYSKVWNT